MLKFYRWLRRFAERQAKNHVNCDIRCPNCYTWASSIQGDFVDLSFGYDWRCGQCGKDSLWNTLIAPVPIRCDEKGLPL
ncbi:hypothetical protein UFOVP353_38 [uncultured Caudovirales phage]|uniref:Uncharacterized protein n=1 Tax=uncultured Caudovirales phage TaxID=2100421 RepID=A0A6J5LYU9_9CAUD|nr:hypothetical protein UFOVP353_38 [uncultured Caudovirales phage]